MFLYKDICKLDCATDYSTSAWKLEKQSVPVWEEWGSSELCEFWINQYSKSLIKSEHPLQMDGDHPENRNIIKGQRDENSLATKGIAKFQEETEMDEINPDSE